MTDGLLSTFAPNFNFAFNSIFLILKTWRTTILEWMVPTCVILRNGRSVSPNIEQKEFLTKIYITSTKMYENEFRKKILGVFSSSKLSIPVCVRKSSLRLFQLLSPLSLLILKYKIIYKIWDRYHVMWFIVYYYYTTFIMYFLFELHTYDHEKKIKFLHSRLSTKDSEI